MSGSYCTVDELKAEGRYSCIGGPFGSNLTQRDYRDEGVPVIRGANLPSDKEFLDDEFVFVSDQKADSLAANTAHPGDLIFTQRGTLGQVGIIPFDSKHPRYIISQSQMKLTVDTTKANPKYVYYFFRQSHIAELIRRRAITSGVPHINLGILKSMAVFLKARPVQDHIVTVLDDYNRFITNNTHRIELLERSARLLFEEWFVRLRYPGHEHDKIDGGMPEGWERKKLGDVYPLLYGKALQENKRMPGQVAVYGSSGEVGTHNVKLASGPGIVVGRKGNVGKIFWIDGDFWPIDTVYFVEPRAVTLFGFHVLSRQSFENSDVAVPGLNRDYAHKKSLKWPTLNLRTTFEEFAKPIFEQRQKLLAMNARLRSARDLLLPRLIDGRIGL